MMIVTQLEHLSSQMAMHARFEKAIVFLHGEGWRGHTDGKIPIDGNAVFGMLPSYETKTPRETIPFEGHRKYIDIQYMIEGKETIYWMPTSGLAPTVPYDDAKDIWFCQSTREGSTPVMLTTGQLIVLFPEDAHAPMHSAGAPTYVRKIVIKVAVSG
jgi:biofilm protein TabA